MCLWAICVYPGSVHLFPYNRKAVQSWKHINLSQIYECRNWETEHYNSVLEITVSLLGIHKWEPDMGERGERGHDIRIFVSQLPKDWGNVRVKVVNNLRKPWLCCCAELGFGGGGGKHGSGVCDGKIGDRDRTEGTVFNQHRQGRYSILLCLGIGLPHYVSKVFPISKCSSYLIIEINFAVPSFSAVGLEAGSNRFWATEKFRRHPLQKMLILTMHSCQSFKVYSAACLNANFRELSSNNHLHDHCVTFRDFNIMYSMVSTVQKMHLFILKKVCTGA
jgi:hypothetical protein